MQNVQKIFDTIVTHYNLKGYPALAEFLGIKYQTLMAWKKRGKIADYSPFMDKCPNISLNWLETGEGEMFVVREESPQYGSISYPPEVQDLIDFYMQFVPEVRKKMIAEDKERRLSEMSKSKNRDKP
jgi:uncharacterized iron-regulated protein